MWECTWNLMRSNYEWTHMAKDKESVCPGKIYIYISICGIMLLHYDIGHYKYLVLYIFLSTNGKEQENQINHGKWCFYCLFFQHPQ